MFILEPGNAETHRKILNSISIPTPEITSVNFFGIDYKVVSSVTHTFSLLPSPS